MAGWGEPVKLNERAVRIGGLAFDRLYANIVFFSSLPFVGSFDKIETQFSSLSTSLACISLVFAIAFFASMKNSAVLMKHRVVFAMAAALSLVGSLLMLPGAEDAGLVVAGAALAGVGSAVLLVGWLAVFTQGSVSGTLIEAGLAFALSFAMALPLSFAGEWALAAAMIVCPILSCSGLWLLSRNTAYCGSLEQSRDLGRKGRNLEIRNTICALCFGYAVGLMRNYSSMHLYGLDSAVLDAILSFSGLVVCVVVVVMSRLANANAARFLYRLSFVGILIACVLVAATRENIIVAVSIAFIAMQCFSCCLIARSMLSSWALGGSPARKCIATFGALYVGEFAGVASRLVLVGWTTVMQVSTVLACCLIVAYAFFFTEADFLLISKKAALSKNTELAPHKNSPLAGASVAAVAGEATNVLPESAVRDADRGEAGKAKDGMDDASCVQGKAELSLEEVCERISIEYGLTPRESEVLPSVARGRTIARIQEELFISASTVNTHIRHIYAKCGVSNRQELLDFVDDRRGC